MIRFLSGFILGYMVAKKPPTDKEFAELRSDIQRSLEALGIRFGKS